jgi:hypothetical protein
MFYRSFFVFFLLAIVLSVLLRYTDSDCPFGIFKLFLNMDRAERHNRETITQFKKRSVGGAIV